MLSVLWVGCGDDGPNTTANDDTTSTSASSAESGSDTELDSDATPGPDSTTTSDDTTSGPMGTSSETGTESGSAADSGTQGESTDSGGGNILFESDAELMDFSNVNDIWTLDLCSTQTDWATAGNCIVVQGSRVMHFEVDVDTMLGRVTFELERFTPSSTTAGVLVDEDELGNPLSLQLVQVPLDTPVLVEGTGEVASLELVFASKPAITLTNVLVLAP